MRCVSRCGGVPQQRHRSGAQPARPGAFGIPAQNLEHLFERYHRDSNVKGIVGTGIGLYLVRMVAALHGGEVAVESQEGQGSGFTVRLPAGARMPA